MRLLALTLALGAANTAVAQAVPEPRPDFRPHRFDEDWRALCTAAQRSRPLDALKCLQLAPAATLTLGGELRERFDAALNPGFGLTQPRESAFQHRALLHGDLRLDDTLRAFVQLGYFDQSGRDAGATPTDVDRLDVTQGFLDLSLPVGSGVATFRGGRQELSFGSSRLVAVREGPNARRSFDGARLFWAGSDYRADFFYARPIEIRSGRFDDRAIRGEVFWGAYATGPVAGFSGLGVDFYFLGYRRDNARFALAAGDERRYTLGTRLFGSKAGFDWDLEAAYQSGDFGPDAIRAWTIASDVGYTFQGIALTPRFGLKADIASGDSDPLDGRLGIFNALYPKLPYFSDANLIAPANVMDIHPSLALSVSPTITVQLGWNALWRQTTGDAIYTTPLRAVPMTAGRPGRFIGHQGILGIDWQPTPNVGVSAEYVHFEPGTALERANGRTVDYIKLSTAYRF